MEMVCNRFRQPVKLPKKYVTVLDNRLWKRNVLHCYAGLAFASRLWKWLANSPPIYRTVLETVLDM
jgi:hypothetical protein